jgi:hypothetical protein
LKLDLGCYESAVPDRFKGSRGKLPHAGPHPPHKRNPVKGTTTCPKSAPDYPLLSLRPPVQIFLDYFCHPCSEFGRPSGTQAPHGVPEPGDKSPGYCHLSLRDAFRPAPKDIDPRKDLPRCYLTLRAQLR